MVVAGSYIIPVAPADWGKPHLLWPLGDVHLGARGCDKARFRQTVQAIAANPLARWLGMGDLFDLILVDDKRFDPEALDQDMEVSDLGELGDVAHETGIAEFSPIKSQCAGLLCGNHDKKAGHFVSAVVKKLAKALGVTYLGYCCLIDLVFARTGTNPLQHRLRVAAHHGAGAARTKGGKLNRVQQFSQDFDADIYLYGHIHARLDDESVELGADAECQKLVEHRKIIVSTGTYLRTYQDAADGATSYGEVKQYQPTPLGSPCIEIVPATGDVSVRKPSGPIHWRTIRAEAIACRQA